ncbi:hypothetical protein [Metabacillus sp. FJAT-53654]|uniref:Phage tail tape measure protein n=1 Tax=Metabacillus rhizosphaerae TaxID=3117747 RepID=A0ABZ2MYB9_9BACI
MSDGSVVIDANIDDDGISRGLAKIRSKLSGLDKNLTKTKSLSASVLLAPSLISSIVLATTKTISLGLAFAGAVAAGAPLLTLAGGLAASFAAAGVGVAAYGVVATSVIGEVFKKSEEIAKLEENLANADTAKERIAAQKELREAMKGVSDEQKNAMDQLASFKSFWTDFTKQFERPILETFSTGLALAKNILTGLAPTIDSVAAVINELFQEMNNGVIEGGLKDFFGWLESNAAESLYNFAHISGNVIGGFFNLLGSFSPIGAEIEEGFLSLSERFLEWSGSIASSTAFQDFVNYAMENGPVLMEIIGNVVGILQQLVTDLAPLGADVLTGLQSFTSLILDNWPVIKETVIGLTVAVGSFVAIMKALQIIGVINTLLVAWRTGTLAATVAQWGLNAAMLANPITWVVALIAGLIAIGVLLYRNWDSVKAKAIELWKAVEDAWDNIWGAIQDAWGKVEDYLDGIDLYSIGKSIMQGLADGFSSIHIPMPHFSVSGSFDMNPMDGDGFSIPSVSFDGWYANGAVFPANSPRLIGVGDNKTYQEAALPLSPSVLGMIGSKIADEMPTPSGGTGEQTIIVQSILDGEVISEQVSKRMNSNIPQSRRRL